MPAPVLSAYPGARPRPQVLLMGWSLPEHLRVDPEGAPCWSSYWRLMVLGLMGPGLPLAVTLSLGLMSCPDAHGAIRCSLILQIAQVNAFKPAWTTSLKHPFPISPEAPGLRMLEGGGVSGLYASRLHPFRSKHFLLSQVQAWIRPRGPKVL